MTDPKDYILIMDHNILFAAKTESIRSIRKYSAGNAGDDLIHLTNWLKDNQMMPAGIPHLELSTLPPGARDSLQVRFNNTPRPLKVEFILGRYHGELDDTPFGPALRVDKLLQVGTKLPLGMAERLSLGTSTVASQMRRANRQEKKEHASAGRDRQWRRIHNRIDTVVQSMTFRIGMFLTALIAIGMFGIMLFEPGENSQFETLWDSLWYSIVTVTTVGYGDKSPITVGGKLVGLVLMGIGVVVLAAITGQIASFFVELQLRRREGLVNLNNVKNHFIICGWRKELEKVIDGVLEVNAKFDVSDLVLVNHVDKEKLQPILDNPRYNKIKYIHGDFIQAETLMRAGISTASRIMVLADFSSDFSQQEVDSRTVMTVLTVESLNKKIYVMAELLDPKFQKFLKLANCDEIILSREYSKLILANASSASGVSHVIGDLLTTHDGQGLRSREIPGEYYGRSFGELFDYLNTRFGDIAIGVLENTGNFYHRKREALSEAQMTPDISRLVENLKSVKQLIPNHSVLNPGRNYIIKSHSRAIVVEARFHEMEQGGESTV